jgi:VWFA-related protein
MLRAIVITVAGISLLNSTLMVGAQLPGQVPASDLPPDQEHVPTLTVNVREVVLDVVAIDSKGHSVKGLKESDFKLQEDGVPQTIKGVSEHSAMSSANGTKFASVGKRPPNSFSDFVLEGNTNSVTVILIDALDSPLEAQMYLRQQLIAFMKIVPPGNTFAIFQMDTRMHLVQGFTSDPQVLLKALESKRDPVALQALLDRNSREQLLDAGLHLMGQYLAGFPGRKNLIWFTGSFPHAVLGLSGNPFPDSIDFDNRSSRAANALSLSRVAVYPIDDRGLEVYAGRDLSYLNPAAGSLGHEDFFHLATGHDFGHAEMERVAEATGGKAFYNTNGLKDALTEIAETGSDYYTLAYSPTNPVWRAHKRNVRITVDGKKITLLYRHTYYARKERKAQRVADLKSTAASRQYVAAAPMDTPTAPADVPGSAPQTPPKEAFGDAMELGTMSSAEVLFHVSVTPATSVIKLGKGEPPPPNSFLRNDFQTKPFREYQLLYVVDPNKISFTQSADGARHARVDFAAVVYNNQGEILNSIVTTEEFNMDESTYRKTLNSQRNVSFQQAIAVPEKGNYFLRLGVHDLVGDLVGALEIPVDSLQKGVAGPAATDPALNHFSAKLSGGPGCVDPAGVLLEPCPAE